MDRRRKGNCLAFDPGKRAVGWAYFFEGQLKDCGLITEDDSRSLFENLAIFAKQWDEWELNIVIEIPQVYRQSKWKGDPNDLIEVAVVSGALGLCFAEKPTRFVKPHDWKGNVPKNIHNDRVLGRLSKPERQIFAEEKSFSKAQAHNVVDAIGLGLWFLKN